MPRPGAQVQAAGAGCPAAARGALGETGWLAARGACRHEWPIRCHGPSGPDLWEGPVRQGLARRRRRRRHHRCHRARPAPWSSCAAAHPWLLGLSALLVQALLAMRRWQWLPRHEKLSPHLPHQQEPPTHAAAAAAAHMCCLPCLPALRQSLMPPPLPALLPRHPPPPQAAACSSAPPPRYQPLARRRSPLPPPRHSHPLERVPEMEGASYLPCGPAPA